MRKFIPAANCRMVLSFDKAGVQYSYDKVGEMASPHGGMQGLGDHLMRTLDISEDGS